MKLTQADAQEQRAVKFASTGEDFTHLRLGDFISYGWYRWVESGFEVIGDPDERKRLEGLYQSVKQV